MNGLQETILACNEMGLQAAPENVLGRMKVLCQTNRICDAWTLQADSMVWMQGALVEVQHHRAIYMLANMMLWEWLGYTIEEGYLKFMRNEEHWLGSTFQEAHLSMLTPAVERTMNALHLVHGYYGSSPIHLLPANRRSAHDPFSKEAFIHIVHGALMTWFGFTKMRGSIQATFTRGLVQLIGVQALLLPPVWDAYMALGDANPPSSLFLSCKASQKDLEDWMQHLRAYPISDCTSTEAGVLARIHNTSCHAVGYFFDMSEINTYYHILEETHLFLPSTSPMELTPIFTHGESPIPSTSQPANLQLQLPPPSTAPYPACLNVHEFQTLLAEIVLLYPFLPPGSQTHSTWTPPTWTRKATPVTPEDHLTNFLAEVQQDDDRLLPFRDLARSRRRVLGPGGPYGSEHLRTRKGLFSALIYRGITHNSQYLRGRAAPQILFSSLTDWNQIVSSHTIQQLCNKKAYGSQTIKNRVVGNAEGFWKATHESESLALDRRLTSWLLDSSTKKLPFHKGFLKLKEKEKKDCGMTTSMGPLVTYLLAADYALAGVFEMPTMAEMGKVIKNIGAGGRDGLELLGFNASTQEDIASSFETLDGLIRSHIPADKLKAMGYNAFVLEHILCKHTRLRVHKLFILARDAMGL